MFREETSEPGGAPPQARPGEGMRIGILTSGGDAQGMNAAVRAVVRSALVWGARPFAIRDGWAGAVRGGASIVFLDCADVAGVLGTGGTFLGTARSPEFEEFSGRHRAAENLVRLGIDRLVVIGGDGSLAGAADIRSEWEEHLDGLVREGVIPAEVAMAHPDLHLVGLVGSIDNDLVGTDTTIGADTALHRIGSAIDQLTSTADAHQKTSVVEVMGRHCGYLALMGAVAGGADFVFTPESPAREGWQAHLCDTIATRRALGRKGPIVVVAEGAQDHLGHHLGGQEVADAIEASTGTAPRLTVLGHVQRGGVPSAYDRWMPTVLGHCAAREVIGASPGDEAVVLGVRDNRPCTIPLLEAIRRTRAVKGLIASGQVGAAQQARGRGFMSMLATADDLAACPVPTVVDAPRVAVVHAGDPAPGMNAAVRALVDLGLSRGWTMLGVEDSWPGLVGGRVRELSWCEVQEWNQRSGAELGTTRTATLGRPGEVGAVARSLAAQGIDALVVIGDARAQRSVERLWQGRGRFPALRMPMVLVPASIENALPDAEFAIGADTALNSTVDELDRMRESMASSRSTRLLGVAAHGCGYLPLVAALASGARLRCSDGPDALGGPVAGLRRSLSVGRALLEIGEAPPGGSSGAIDEGGAGRLLDEVLMGAPPSPFDRILAARYAHRAVECLADQFAVGAARAVRLTLERSVFGVRPVPTGAGASSSQTGAPVEPWWAGLVGVLETVTGCPHPEDRVGAAADGHVQPVPMEVSFNRHLVRSTAD